MLSPVSEFPSFFIFLYVGVQSLSHVWLFVTPWTAACRVLHCLLEFAQIHVHWVDDTIQPSHPLSSPSSFTLNLSQHQGLFQWGGSSHHMTKVLELQLQPFQWVFRVDFLKDWLVWSPCCLRDSQESSPAPHFESINSLVLSYLWILSKSRLIGSFTLMSFPVCGVQVKSSSSEQARSKIVTWAIRCHEEIIVSVRNSYANSPH